MLLRSRMRVALLVVVVLLWVFAAVAGGVAEVSERGLNEWPPVAPEGDFSVSPRSDPLEFAFGFRCP